MRGLATDVIAAGHLRQLPFLAVGPFERAVAKDPGNPTFHYHLGVQTALKLRPDFADATKALGALDR